MSNNTQNDFTHQEMSETHHNIEQTPLANLPKKPWSASATFGLTFLLLIVYSIVSAILIAVGVGFESAHLGLTPEAAEAMTDDIVQSLILDGDFTAISYLITALCISPLIIYLAGRRKITTAAAYLGFTKLPTKKTFINFNLALLAYFIFAYFAMDLLAIEMPQSIMEIYNSTDYLILLLITVVIAAPLFEELLFRGFIYKGLKHSKLGIIGTIIITSILFTLIHAAQYELSILITMLPLAFILGLSRYRSGGIYLPIYLHFVNNLYSCVELYLTMN